MKGVYTGAQDVKLEITTTSKELVNERKGKDHTTSVYPNTSVDYTKVDYDKWNAPYEQNAYVYSIYDSNYYIIASVVLGDAQGATANYAYILGDAKSEWVEHGSGSLRRHLLLGVRGGSQRREADPHREEQVRGYHRRPASLPHAGAAL